MTNKMEKLEFYIVDVFAEKKYAGNQLAVFRNTHSLNETEMQAIAREINFSETTFINSDEIRNGGFDVRIFTPGAEVPFAGHPTLGTAFIIKEFVLKENVESLTLNLAVGQIPVDLIYRNGLLADLWMKQKSPDFGRMLTPADITPILNIDEQHIDSRFPIQEVSTGLPFFIVPLTSLKAVQRAKVNQESYYNFVQSHNPKLESADSDNVISSAFFIFTQETQNNKNNIHARMFDDYYGVPEDPATGSANGCLLAYLLKYNYFGKKVLNLRVEQGYEMNRPSLLKIQGRSMGEDEMDIFVGGQVQMIAKGEWHC